MAVATGSVGVVPELVTGDVFQVDGLLDDVEAEALSAVWHGFSPYRPSSAVRTAQRKPVRTLPGPVGTHGSGPTSQLGFETTLPARFDAGQNFGRTGGRFGRLDQGGWASGIRNDYFRETYATGGTIYAERIEMLVDHRGLADAARTLFGLSEVVPVVVYANILIPGQELGLHTDVPEFRMAPGARIPAWLRVVMRHSGLFEYWRLPIATAIVYLGEPVEGGAFAYYPNGATGPAATVAPEPRSAVILDADTVFHGVDPVGAPLIEPPSIEAGSRLVHEGDRRWSLYAASESGGAEIETFHSDGLRFSVSWKAACFADEGDRLRWTEHSDDLPAGRVIETLTTELVARSLLRTIEHGLTNDDLGRLLVDEFVRFPPPEKAKLEG